MKIKPAMPVGCNQSSQRVDIASKQRVFKKICNVNIEEVLNYSKEKHLPPLVNSITAPKLGEKPDLKFILKDSHLNQMLLFDNKGDKLICMFPADSREHIIIHPSREESYIVKPKDKPYQSLKKLLLDKYKLFLAANSLV